MANSPQKEILDSIDIIAKGYYDKTAQLYDGLVISVVSSTVYEIKVNGQTYNLPRYGTVSPDINSTVKVFVPRNNWAQAYFIVAPGNSGGTGTTNYNELTNQPQINAVTLSGNKTSANLGLYGTGNEPPYPVTSVNSRTGAVVLTQDDIGNGTNYVQTENNFTDANVTKLSGIATGAQVNVIESVQKNGTALTITNKTVNVTVPTKTSDITNDSGYITSAQAPVQSVNGYTGTVILTKSDVGLSNVANVLQYSASNPPPYPVTSVNSLTGAVSLTTDNIPATTTNRYVPAVPTTNPDTSYLNGNGTFSTLAVGGASSVANVFFSNTASTVSGYKTLNYVADNTATELSVTMTSAADVLSATYLYSAPLGVTVIDAGIWDSSFYMKCSTASTGVNRLKMVAFVRHTDGTETDLFTKYSSSVNLTVYDSYYTQTNHPSFTVLATDILGVRIYGNTTRNASTTITYTIGGTNASFFNTPLALRHSQLRDLNGDTSYQHISTALVSQISTNEQKIALLDTDITDLQTSLATETTNRQNADTSLQNQINTKLETTGDGSNVTSTFAASETFTNITSGSKLSLLFGKIYTAISNLISHIANTSNPHSVTKAQVGLGNVANVLQYSTDNPPPYPVTSVNGSTGAVVLSIPTKTSDLTNDSNFKPILNFNNISVASSVWASSTVYSNYPYAATVSLSGVTSSYIPDVTFGVGDADSGNFAPVALTGTGTLTIYAASAPTSTITLQSIVCIGG